VHDIVEPARAPGSWLDASQHAGHRQMIVAALIAMVKPLSSFTALPTTKPRGTSSEKSNPCML
jgi:hypothetical protein